MKEKIYSTQVDTFHALGLWFHWRCGNWSYPNPKKVRGEEKEKKTENKVRLAKHPVFFLGFYIKILKSLQVTM